MGEPCFQTTAASLRPGDRFTLALNQPRRVVQQLIEARDTVLVLARGGDLLLRPDHLVYVEYRQD